MTVVSEGLSEASPALPRSPNSPTVQAFTLDAAHPSKELQFSLVHPSEITGRVVDEDGKPVSGVTLVMQAKSSTSPFMAGGAVTAKDGSFTAANLSPVRTSSTSFPNLNP